MAANKASYRLPLTATKLEMAHLGQLGDSEPLRLALFKLCRKKGAIQQRWKDDGFELFRNSLKVAQVDR